MYSRSVFFLAVLWLSLFLGLSTVYAEVQPVNWFPISDCSGNPCAPFQPNGFVDFAGETSLVAGDYVFSYRMDTVSNSAFIGFSVSGPGGYIGPPSYTSGVGAGDHTQSFSIDTDGAYIISIFGYPSDSSPATLTDLVLTCITCVPTPPIPVSVSALIVDIVTTTDSLVPLSGFSIFVYFFFITSSGLLLYRRAVRSTK